MALFKIFKGQSGNLGQSSNGTNKTYDGYAYFTPDDGKFYIDIATSNAAITTGTNRNRVPLSAEKADLIKQHNTTNSENYKILLSYSANPQSGAIDKINYGTNLTYNPVTNKLKTGNIELTGELDVTGNAYLRNETTADSLTAGSLLVNGAANFVQSPTGPTAAAGDSSTKLATTEFVVNAFATNDTKVTQSSSTTESWRKVLLHHTADTSGTAVVTTDTNVVYAAQGIAVQPSTGTLKATRFEVTGSAGSTNQIASDNATNIFFRVNNKVSLVITDTVVRSSSTIPKTIDLGTSAVPWKDIYGVSLHVGNLMVGGTVDTTEGKTITSNTTLYLKSAANTSILFQPNGTTAARFDTSGYFKPETTGGSQLGTSANKWAKLYVGTADSYGSTSQPIYWNNGVPTAITGALANNITGNASTATSASKLQNTAKIGDTNKPVYFTASGVPAAISHTIETSVPSGAVFTDTKVTAVGNHYIPSADTNSQLTASASGATAAWSIDVVKAIQLQRDAKGHVTGVTVTSGKIPDNPNTDTLVKQNASTTNANYKLLLTTTASPTSGTAYEANYGANLTYNPSTNILTTGNLNLTGELDVTGNAYLRNETTIDSLTADSILVNGAANFVQYPTAPTPASGDNSTKVATTEFVTNSVAGLSGAMHFKGTTTTAIVDGSTTNPISIGGSNYTATAGDVVLREISTGNIFEYVWTGSAWEMLGRDTSFKVTQTAVPSPTANGNTTAFIDTISQDTNGNITITKKNLDTSGTWSGTAAKATADESGNVITSTYLKLSGGTMTGIIQPNTTKAINFGLNDKRWNNIYGDKLILGNYVSNVLSINTVASGTLTEVLIKTNIPWTSSTMHKIHLYGHRYTGTFIDMDFWWYNYGSTKFYQPSFLDKNNTNIFTNVKLFLYDYEEENPHIGILLQSDNCAGLYLKVDYIHNQSQINAGGDWSSDWTYQLNTTTNTTLIPDAANAYVQTAARKYIYMAQQADKDGSGNVITSTYLTGVSWDNSNKKLTKTINGSTTDVVAVTVNNPTLAWNTESTIAKIGTVEIKTKLPANPNTDEKVKQTAKTDNVNYKLLFTSSASPTSGNAAEAAYDTDITINPSTNTITATTFSGNAATASKLTNLTSTDNASSSATWRKVWISYSDNVTGRPALTEALTFQTSTGILKATKFQGDGSNLTSLNASNLSSGTVAFARLPSMYWANTAVASAASYNTTPEVASVKIGNGTVTAAGAKSATLQYDATLEVLNFVFT